MSTSTLNRQTASPCGCGGGTTGTAVATRCSCGGSGCAACATQGYVRPRFFAGQLLTEEDLQALSDYVVNKNRLHNRHFFGDGVVCGLQVGCGPCGGSKIIVQPGHALDCCGNDLVLECAVELDAIAMVRDLRLKQRGGADCGDPCADRLPNGEKRDPNQKDDTARHYCLYLRYHEELSDPVAPYATDEPCGGSACEATRVREDVRFELRCRDDMGPKDGFLKRVVGCLRDLAKAEALSAALAKLFQPGATPDDVAAAREAMLDQLDVTTQLSDCRLRADVAAIAIPPAGGDIKPATKLLLFAYLRMLRDCICRALLPPCPPCDDTGVLLACLTMQDCQVTDICNLERKFVLTGPNLRYWLPIDLFGDVLEALCCTPLKVKVEEPQPEVPGQPPAPPAGVAAPFALRSVVAPRKAHEDRDELQALLIEHVRVAFGLDERNLTQLEHIASNMGDMVDASGLDDLLLVRVLRDMFEDGGEKPKPSGDVVSAADLKRATDRLGQQQTALIEATRTQMQGEQAKAVSAMTAQNAELSKQLATLTDRLGKLEGKPIPAAPAKAPRKPKE